VTLKEKFLGTGSGNLLELEREINKQAVKGVPPAHHHDRVSEERWLRWW
jgi:hypothetical protein